MMRNRLGCNYLKAGIPQALAQFILCSEMGASPILQFSCTGVPGHLLAFARAQVAGAKPSHNHVAPRLQDAQDVLGGGLASRRAQVPGAMNVQHRAKAGVAKWEPGGIRQNALTQTRHGMPRDVQGHHVMTGRFEWLQELAVAHAQLQHTAIQVGTQGRQVSFTPPRRGMILVEPIPGMGRPPHSPATTRSHKGPPGRTPVARRRNKGEEKRIARTRMRVLLDNARTEALGPDADLANRYARLARRVGTRYQTPLTPAQKAQVCKGCGGFRIPGRTSRSRIHAHRIVTTCLQCGRIDRRPL